MYFLFNLYKNINMKRGWGCTYMTHTHPLPFDQLSTSYHIRLKQMEGVSFKCLQQTLNMHITYGDFYVGHLSIRKKSCDTCKLVYLTSLRIYMEQIKIPFESRLFRFDYISCLSEWHVADKNHRDKLVYLPLLNAEWTCISSFI